MADDATSLKNITDALEATYQALRQAASNISGLLQAGAATCDEVKAYNLWALAIYNTQIGMLEALRQGGEANVPDLPSAPTLFVWAGTSGADAWQLDCAGQPSSLSGVMGRALAGPTPTSQYLSTDQIQIVTQDQYAFNPAAAPSFKTLFDVQQARLAPANLGIAGGIVIVICALAVLVSIGITAITSYLKTNAVQEANTQETQAQAQAFANYTAARLGCYGPCVAGGQSPADCVATCAKLVDKPNIQVPGMSTSWGLLQWTGAVVLIGVGALVARKLYQRHQEGRPFLVLPESVRHAMNPPRGYEA